MSKRKKIWNQAKRVMKDKKSVRSVVEQARAKLNDKLENTNELNEAASKLQTLIEMVRAYAKGDRTTFSNRTLLLAVFVLLYFVIPTDVIPDFVPALGFTDDISVLYLVYKQIHKDVERYLNAQQE